MAKGKLFIIEAGDGSGKETQTRLLAERLERDGHSVLPITFPDYAADSSMLVRMYLRGDFGTHADDVNAYAASTFFAVDRYASYRTKWGRDYETGAVILADRYTTSNMVHQAVKIRGDAERDAFLDWLYDLEFRKMGLPVPDAVFFLDMEPAAAQRLIAARAENSGAAPDIHERDADYLARTHDAYVLLAARYGWVRIPSSTDGAPLPIAEIHERLYREVRKYWGGEPCA
ncbi:dTMP kinase [Selenomonas sp. FOBRC9]|uniref:dTMP kinase n=1 Tax=Selenomonas sp. FOBRC9 TaxID=936573 RepID=UPI00027A44EC|nr:thymidylate kinase [Selenomonas sp. FOBRC9]EJP28190.1 dTMP kinase [Selenomonas sp. FOBRC9]